MIRELFLAVGLMLCLAIDARAQTPTCTSSSSNTGGTTIVFSPPSGTVDGSFMFAVISSNSTDTGWVAPTPFNQLATSGGLSAVLYSGFQSGAAPANYTWSNLDGSPNHSGIVVACNGSGGLQTFSANNGGTGLAVANSVTPLFSNEINYLFYNANGGFSTPTGYTADQAVSHGGNTFAADFFLANPTVGTPTGNQASSTSGSWGAFQLLVEGPTPTPTATPSAAPTGTPTVAPTGTPTVAPTPTAGPTPASGCPGYMGGQAGFGCSNLGNTQKLGAPMRPNFN